MSPTHRPKPPDKGAPPEHKPSRKVALEEVMRSLQDLVSNELTIEPVKQPGETMPNAPAKPHAAKKKPAASSAPPQAIEIDSAQTSPETEFITLESLPEPAVTAQPAPEPTPQPASTRTVPTGGLQQELPYLDVRTPVPDTGLSEVTAESRTEEIVPARQPTSESKIGSRTPGVPPADTEDGAPSDLVPLAATEALAAPIEEINWDDIPVLEEAVEIPDEIVVHDAGQATDGSVAATLPPADVARRLAIQVAARLNVELRKSGQNGLSSDIIARLARLLQEALAKGAANMENSPPDKH